MATIIKEAGFSPRHIDFISVDVQGSEYDVLSSADPSGFKIVLVEQESVTHQKNEKVRKLMRHTGHRRLNLTTVGWDKAGYNELWVLPPLDALDPRPDSVRGVSIITPPMKKMLRQRKAMQIARLLDGYLGMAKSAL